MIGGEDGLTWYHMRPFWRAYHPWLAARGFHLFEPLPDDLGYTLPPPTQCSPALPYATYAHLGLNPSFQIVPSVSEFGVGGLALDSSMIIHAAKIRPRP